MANLSFDFSDCRVLVTGGTSGIGACIARAFRGAGAEVTEAAESDLRRAELHRTRSVESHDDARRDSRTEPEKKQPAGTDHDRAPETANNVSEEEEYGTHGAEKGAGVKRVRCFVGSR